MNMPAHHGFDAARAHSDSPAVTYICCDCEVEHRGFADRVPQGWDVHIACGHKMRDFGPVTVIRCPDCLEAIEDEHAAGHVLHQQAARMHQRAARIEAFNSRPGFGITLGILAARYAGGIGARP